MRSNPTFTITCDSCKKTKLTLEIEDYYNVPDNDVVMIIDGAIDGALEENNWRSTNEKYPQRDGSEVEDWCPKCVKKASRLNGLR